MKYLNTQCVILNIYYMVGNYVDWTETFNEVFCEIAGGSFGVYVFISANLFEDVF